MRPLIDRVSALAVAAACTTSAGCFFATSCVARGTRVLTPNGWRPIEDLRVGDEVFAVDETSGERHTTPITAIRTAEREVGTIAFAGDNSLRLTTDHPVYCPVRGEYMPAGDWLLGERTRLLRSTDDGVETVHVAGVEVYSGVAEVFDITVEHELHNFIAEGVVVHNKSPAEPPDCVVDGKERWEREWCECDDGTAGPYYSCDIEGCLCLTDAGDVSDDAGASNSATEDTSMPNGSTSDASRDVSQADDQGSDASADLSTDAGTPRHRGTCEDASDCPDSNPCVSLGAPSPYGYHACQSDTAAEPGCATIEPPDSCCLHTDCQADENGLCIAGPIFYCGGIAPVPANVCMYDECSADADCGDESVCVPGGVFGEPVSRCVAATCGQDADCTARDGGQCSTFFDPCNNRFAGFHCTYADSECRTDSDCPPDMNDPGQPYCAPGMDGETECRSFTPPP